jgi:hypothetical protein
VVITVAPDRVFATLHTLLKAESKKSRSKAVVSFPEFPVLSLATQLFRAMAGTIFEGPSKGNKAPAAASASLEQFNSAETGVLYFKRYSAAIPPSATIIIYIGVHFNNCKRTGSLLTGESLELSQQLCLGFRNK